jgi:hypothetical protein
MQDTSETREITSRVSAKESEIIQEPKELVLKTKLFSVSARREESGMSRPTSEWSISRPEEYAMKHS